MSRNMSHGGGGGYLNAPVKCLEVRNNTSKFLLRILSKRLKLAFTLAEVLITLGVVGVVAALTMPMLIANYQKNVISTQLQKDYSLMQNALKYSESKYESPVNWDAFTPYGNDVLCNMDKFIEKFTEGITPAKIFTSSNVIQTSNIGMCGSDKVYGRLSKYGTIAFGTGDGRQKSASILLPAGSCWLFYFKAESHQKNLVRIFVDTNGPNKNPNRAGIDLFAFILTTDNQILPVSDDDCHPEQKNDRGIGLGCTAKVMGDGWKFKDDYPWNW